MKYTLYIGEKYAGQFRTLKDCRDHARDNGGYRYGWSIYDNHNQREVLNKGESAVHYTNRIHNEFYESMGCGLNALALSMIFVPILLAVVKALFGN